ncbi:LCP family protein [Actinacidiphila yeochonensis]|uniref:LCP family protein n=1 Tax=Actinacidiphila yeochonensis TaxID=89050 RepID=UPI00055A536B|nr:LCP family protein [Actinacidiphila yeochonensis]
MNDANPRRPYGHGGPDTGTDPYGQGPYYEQQPYGYDAYGRPVAPPPPDPRAQGVHQDPYQGTYQGPGHIPQQPQQPYYGQPPGPDGHDTGQYPGYPGYSALERGYGPGGSPTGQMPVYGAGPRQDFDTGQHTGQFPAYDTGQQPVYGGGGPHTGQTPVYDGGSPTGQMPVYGAGPRQDFDTGQHTGQHTGQFPAYDTGQQPVYGGGGPHTGRTPVYDGGSHTAQMPVQDGGGHTGQVPVHDSGGPHTGQLPRQKAGPEPDRAAEDGEGGGPRTGLGYQEEPFAFVDEDSEESEDVIDWLKFSESRTERREEARRRGRNRRVGLVLVLVLALLGGAGYLWDAGKIPGLKKSGAKAAATGGSQRRDVILVHLMPVDGGPSSTALLVDNTTKKHGTTVLIPNALQVSGDDGTMTLDKSVEDGVGPTRDALNALLGTDISGSWRLDSPYLELLVDSLGNVLVDTNASVKGTGKDKDKVLVPKGEQQELTGQAAVAYATYRAPGEPQTAQLARFGQVMEAVLEKMPSDTAGATKTVQALTQILDPSLTESQLGASLAALADLAKTGAYSTLTLPVGSDGTLSDQAAATVKSTLGTTVKPGGASSGEARVAVKDASGEAKAASMAQAAITNSGSYSYVPGGKAATTQKVSQVLYSDASREAAAKDVATTLDLPVAEVGKGTVPANADILVVLGGDYKPSQT